MRRGGAAMERVAVVVVGLALMALGLAAVAWQQDWIPDAAGQLDVSVVAEQADADWWPWAVGGAGVVLIVVGLFWLVAHARRRTVRRLELTGTGSGGRLTVNASTVVDAARPELEAAAGLRLSSGRVIVGDRGEHIVDLRARLDPGADLDEATDAALRVESALGAALGPESPLRCRVVLTGRGTKSKTSRVH